MAKIQLYEFNKRIGLKFLANIVFGCFCIYLGYLVGVNSYIFIGISIFYVTNLTLGLRRRVSVVIMENEDLIFTVNRVILPFFSEKIIVNIKDISLLNRPAGLVGDYEVKIGRQSLKLFNCENCEIFFKLLEEKIS
jgi:hypothetical protein